MSDRSTFCEIVREIHDRLRVIFPLEVDDGDPSIAAAWWVNQNVRFRLWIEQRLLVETNGALLFVTTPMHRYIFRAMDDGMEYHKGDRMLMDNDRRAYRMRLVSLSQDASRADYFVPYIVNKVYREYPGMRELTPT